MTNLDGGTPAKIRPSTAPNGHAIKTRAPAKPKAKAKAVARPAQATPEVAATPASPAWRKWVGGGLALLVVAALGGAAWWYLKPAGLEAGFASGNGRIEAVEINVSTKTAGRLTEILVQEGQFVKSGQVLALMDTQVLDAQRAEATAQLARAENAIAIQQSAVLQRQSERLAGLAVVAQRRAELNAAGKRVARSRVLSAEGAASTQEYDDDLASQQGKAAAVGSATAQVAAQDAAIAAAEAQVIGARSSVEAARATVTRVEVEIADSALKSPVDGRVQYRVAQPAEVLGAGGVVLNLVDVTDVHITFFLPEAAVGKVAMGAEVRIVLDAAPQWVIPAKASFVSAVAQFTPKSVETASERQKLVFRVKGQIDPTLLRKFAKDVKTGLPGLAYVRLDETQPWPARLAIHVPE